MKIVFDTKGNEKQKLCAKYWIDDETIDIGYGGSKGGAKSHTGCTLIFGDGLMYPETHYFIARKKLNDLRKFTIPSIYEVLDGWGLNSEKYCKYNGQDNFFQLYNGSKVFLLDAKYIPSDPNYMRFGSMQMTRGWIEEAGEFEEECKNNLQASIGRWKNDLYNLKPKLLQTFNPSKNYLYREYYKKHNENKLEPHKKFIQALPSDNKMLPKDYVPNLLKILSPNEIQRLVYGNWEFDDNPNALFEYKDILNLFTNEFVKRTGVKYITADIAYEGSDMFVIGVWDGLVLEKIYAIDKIDETQVSKKLHEIRIENSVPISNLIYDADGLKMFVRESAVSGYLNGANQFHNNGSPIRVDGQVENYYNLKAQCYFMLADYVKKNKIYISCKEYRKQIIEELEQICKLPLSDDGKARLEKKDALKERLRRSPDFADMVMMRLWFELNIEDDLVAEWD